MADDPVVECHPLSGRGDGVKKDRVLKQNPPSYKHQIKGAEEKSHFPTVFKSQSLKVKKKSYKDVIELRGGRTCSFDHLPGRACAHNNKCLRKVLCKVLFPTLSPHFANNYWMPTTLDCRELSPPSQQVFSSVQKKPGPVENERFCQLPEPSHLGAGAFAFGVIR